MELTFTDVPEDKARAVLKWVYMTRKSYVRFTVETKTRSKIIHKTVNSSTIKETYTHTLIDWRFPIGKITGSIEDINSLVLNLNWLQYEEEEEGTSYAIKFPETLEYKSAKVMTKMPKCKVAKGTK